LTGENESAAVKGVGEAFGRGPLRVVREIVVGPNCKKPSGYKKRTQRKTRRKKRKGRRRVSGTRRRHTLGEDERGAVAFTLARGNRGRTPFIEKRGRRIISGAPG